MRNAVQLCLAAYNVLHMGKGNRAFLLSRSCVKMADRFASRGYSFKKKQTRWSYDKTIIELDYRKLLFIQNISPILIG